MAQMVLGKQLSSRQSGSRFLIIFLITSHNLCVKAKNMDVWLFILLAGMNIPTKLKGVAEQTQKGACFIMGRTRGGDNEPLSLLKPPNASVFYSKNTRGG